MHTPLNRRAPLCLPGRRGALCWALTSFAMTGLWSVCVLAVPGPDSVAVLANTQVPQSVALMERYAKLRHIPAGQRCAVDVPPYDDISAADFHAMVRAPLEACLTASESLERIEAVVVMRGMPRRVLVGGPSAQRPVSFTAALGVSRSTRVDDGAHVVGLDAGVTLPSGGFRATWTNPYKSGPFHPGFEVPVGPYRHRLWLVTALDGYSFKDAEVLMDSSMAAEPFDLTATWLLMKGADAARGVLDHQLPGIKESLSGLVPSPVELTDFQAELGGRHLAAFVVGTDKLGATIESNTFTPGALVDNVTSFGAVPGNFIAADEGGTQSQVSIARWVRKGVAGVHGTVAEPLNNCFPSRQFLVDYAEGATLAEAYWRNMPFVYWMNMVLGDPMTAPFAKRPTLSAEASGRVSLPEARRAPTHDAAGAAKLTVKADGEGDDIARLRIFIDGQLSLELPGPATTLTAEVELEGAAEGIHEVLAVAQFASALSGGGVWRSKGWQAWSVEVTSAPTAASSTPPGSDGGCHMGRGRPSTLWTLYLALLSFVLWRRARSAP